MESFYLIWFFIVGLFMGSFYGVVGGRLPNNESIVKPRSHCSFCNHVLKWYELIPVFSFIFQRGKCRKCKKSISIFYPIVELATGLLFAISYYIFGFSYNLLIALLISSILSIVLVSDVLYFIIPDSVIIIFSILMIIVKFVFLGFESTLFSIFSGIIMFIIMYSIMIIGNKIFKKECLGGADIKLMFFTGLIISPALGLLSIFIASCIALPISLFLIFKNKDNIIPYGPFLLIGLYLVFSFGIDFSFFQII